MYILMRIRIDLIMHLDNRKYSSYNENEDPFSVLHDKGWIHLPGWSADTFGADILFKMEECTPPFRWDAIVVHRAHGLVAYTVWSVFWLYIDKMSDLLYDVKGIYDRNCNLMRIYIKCLEKFSRESHRHFRCKKFRRGG